MTVGRSSMGQRQSIVSATNAAAPSQPAEDNRDRRRIDDEGCASIPEPMCGPPPAKRAAVATTDLSDRHIRLCAKDAIMAVQERVLSLGMVDGCTTRHSVLPDIAMRRQREDADLCVLDGHTQQAIHEMLHGPLTALQHETALRRHAACGSCNLCDVLRVSDLGQRVFLLVPLRWRGPFARVCHEWNDIARLCWQADEFELVDVLQIVHLRSLGASVAQLSSWVRASQHNKPIFFLLALSEDGRLEQMRIACKKAEPGLRRPDADDDIKVENAKDWHLEDAVPKERPSSSISAQFVVTKHHAYCVIAVRGQALLIKLGGQSSGSHEHMYTERFPSKVTTMSMCPLDNNIIAFGVPVLAEDGVCNLIELVNFAQSAKIQTLRTCHQQPMVMLDYSPDSEQLLSCSGDSIQVWCKETLETRGPGAMEEKAERTLIMPKGSTVRIAKVHPAWTSVLLATNEALEVRELRRCSGELLQLREPDDRGLAMKWRRENMQVTAAAFIAQGNMLVVSDRGDRLLLLNYHGLHAAKRVVLAWEHPSLSRLPIRPECTVCTVTAITECPDVARSEEWRSGVSHLAVSNSRGEVVLVKI